MSEKKQNIFNTHVGTDTILKSNLVVLIMVCITFTTINIFTRNFAIASVLAGMGVVAVIIAVLLKRHAGEEWRMIFITTAQFMMIFIAALCEGNVHNFFPLYLASAIMCGVYFNRKIVLVQGIVINICVLGSALFLWNIAYKGADMLVTGKCILGLDVGILLMYLVVSWGNVFINEAKENADEARGFLKEAREKAEESAKLSQRQEQIFAGAGKSAQGVTAVSSEMSDIVSTLNAGTVKQAQSVEEITQSIKKLSEQMVQTEAASLQSSALETDAIQKLDHGNAELENMLIAMQEIQTAASEISKVMKSIDDIAFQTNILALNASVEAARAGSAGKGFAVVAQEVRSLSGKSANASQSAGALMQHVDTAIAKGRAVASSTAEAISAATGSSKQSGESVEEIRALALLQKETIEVLKEELEEISSVVSENMHAAQKSATLSAELEHQSKGLQKIMM
ncbi:MAG: methyl-accepting chemotaxis protein [Oscillospiraceae bacterium]